MPPGETRVDLVALAGVSTDLAGEGTAVHDEAAKLDLTPDCGKSSDETARAVGGVAAAVAAIAEHLSTFASTLTDTIASYQASDDRSVEQLNGAGGPP